MDTQALYVPERHLSAVIDVIRAGLESVEVPREVSEQLDDWCDWTEELSVVLESSA